MYEHMANGSLKDHLHCTSLHFHYTITSPFDVVHYSSFLVYVPLEINFCGAVHKRNISLVCAYALAIHAFI